MTTAALSGTPDSGEPIRIPPQDLEAERNLLGSMMLNRNAIPGVLSVINRNESEWFYRPDHRKLFETLIDIYDDDHPMDLVVVRNELRRRNLLDEVGGVPYIVQLAESVGSWAHAEHYARIVRDKGLLRDVIRAATQIAEDAYAESDPTADLLDKAEQMLFDVTERRVSGQAVTLSSLVHQLNEQLQARGDKYLTGMPSGFHELDDLTSGFQSGDFIIVAGRPSMGKTAFGLTVAEHMAVDDGRPVVFFSMEMSKIQVGHRILCSRSRIDSHKVRRNMLTEEDTHMLMQTCDQLKDSPLLIDDTPGMSILELRAKARRLKQQHDVRAVFVDYLQLMRCPGKEKEGRQQEIAEISRGLKSLGRELNIPIISMAQLNRAAEQREGNRPRMSDLRESGAIEQDADVVLLLHREEYYHRGTGEVDPDIKNRAELIVAKQRNGPVGTINLVFNSRSTRFDNLAPIPDPGFGPPLDEDTAPF
jgi:replicative DNA helicase